MLTVDELAELIAKAERTTGEKLTVSRNYAGYWDIIGRTTCRYNSHNTESNQAVRWLQELATPPKPDMIEISIPFKAAQWAADLTNCPEAGEAMAIAAACEIAVRPWAEIEQR